MKDRHIVGAGAAACALYCVPLLLAAIGVAGAGATLLTFLAAGTVFALVVGLAAAMTVWRMRSARSRPDRDVEECIGPRPPSDL